MTFGEYKISGLCTRSRTLVLCMPRTPAAALFLILPPARPRHSIAAELGVSQFIHSSLSVVTHLDFRDAAIQRVSLLYI